MSQYIWEDTLTKIMYGWDHPLQTFYLQIHAKTQKDQDGNPIVWYGTQLRELYEVEDLVRVARKHHIVIEHKMQVELYLDKDLGV